MHDVASLRWDDLRVLLAVSRAGSFTHAARALGTDQSTVTRRMAALERALGQPLFERHHDGPSATLACRALLVHAEAVERGVSELLVSAERERHAEAGRVRLATTESFAAQVLVPHVLAPFRAAHPQLTVELVLADTAADLPRREADLALRFFRPSAGDVVARRLADLPMAVLAQRAYAGRRRVRKLAELDWIVHQLPRGQSVDAHFLAAFPALVPALFVNSHLVQVEAVRAGLGVALLTRALQRLDPRLVELRLAERPALPSVPLWLVAARSVRGLPRVDALWRFLEARLPPLLSAGNAPRPGRSRSAP